MVADRDTVELGVEIGKQRAAVAIAVRDQAALETKGRRAAGRVGVLMTQDRLRQPGTADDLHRLNQLLNEDQPATSTTTQGNP